MKNKQIPFLYGISTVQLIGIIGLSVNTMAGTAVVAVGTVGILVYATANLFQRLKERFAQNAVLGFLRATESARYVDTDTEKASRRKTDRVY